MATTQCHTVKGQSHKVTLHISSSGMWMFISD